MTKILAACICFFNEAKSIKRCIESIHDGVDLIFCVDGRFPDYEYTNDFSDDGSQEVIDQFPKTRLVNLHGSELDKRNFYLELCKVYEIEWGLMIDADEFILPGADWAKFRENCRVNATIHNPICGIRYEYNHKDHHGYTPYPRLWFRPGQLRYFERHNQFKHEDGRIWQSSDGAANAPMIEGITMAGDDDLRNPDHIKRVYDYQVKLIEKEKLIRERK